jgi:hypothetical protein
MNEKKYRSISKSQLAKMYDISLATLSKYLNELFYADLEPLGYRKRSVILPPIVIKKFKELYGEPEII